MTRSHAHTHLTQYFSTSSEAFEPGPFMSNRNSDPLHSKPKQVMFSDRTRRCQNFQLWLPRRGGVGGHLSAYDQLLLLMAAIELQRLHGVVLLPVTAGKAPQVEVPGGRQKSVIPLQL